MIGIFKNFIFILFVIFLASCATSLTKDTKEIQIIEDENWPSCKNLGEIRSIKKSHEDVRIELLNTSAQRGANRVKINFIEYLDRSSTYGGIAIALKCSDFAGKTIYEIKPYCESKEYFACLDLVYAYFIINEPAYAKEVACKLCDENKDETCQHCKSLEIFENNWKIKKSLIKSCDANIYQDCYRLSVGLFNENDIVSSMNLAQRACNNGVNEACAFFNQVLQVKLEREQAIRNISRQSYESQPVGRSTNVNPMLAPLQYLNEVWGSPKSQPMPQETPKVNCVSKQVSGYYGSTVETECR